MMVSTYLACRGWTCERKLRIRSPAPHAAFRLLSVGHRRPSGGAQHLSRSRWSGVAVSKKFPSSQAFLAFFMPQNLEPFPGDFQYVKLNEIDGSVS
jgi:hypothetical protein